MLSRCIDADAGGIASAGACRHSCSPRCVHTAATPAVTLMCCSNNHFNTMFKGPGDQLFLLATDEGFQFESGERPSLAGWVCYVCCLPGMCLPCCPIDVLDCHQWALPAAALPLPLPCRIMVCAIYMHYIATVAAAPGPRAALCS